MKKILLSISAVLVLTPILEAGGDIAPIIVPIVLDDPNPWYIGAGFVLGKFNDCHDGCEYEDVTYGAMVRGGYEWNQYIGIEARAIRTFLGEDELGGEQLQHIGLFAKPSYPLGEDFNVYGLLGYGWTKTITTSPYLPEVSENGFSWGIGFEFDLSDKDDDFDENTQYDREFDGQADQERGWGLFIDYQKLLVDSNLPDMSVISIGVTYDF